MDYRHEALEILKHKTSLVFEGGGALGSSVVSGLERLMELGALTEIDNVTGSSVGSILGTAVACRASLEYMKDTLYGLDFNEFQDNKGIFFKIYNLIFKKGMNSTEPIRAFADKILKDLVHDSEITFLRLFERTGIKLTITYLSLKERRTVYANYITTPNQLVREAIVKSSTIPLFYKPYLSKNKKLKDMIYDGGVMNNYPINYPRETGENPANILGFKFVSEDENPINNEITGKVPKNTVETFTYLIELIRQQALKVHVHKKDWMLSVKIAVGELKSTDFEMTEEDKQWLFKQGRIAVDNYVNELTQLLKNGEYPY